MKRLLVLFVLSLFGFACSQNANVNTNSSMNHSAMNHSEMKSNDVSAPYDL